MTETIKGAFPVEPSSSGRWTPDIECFANIEPETPDFLWYPWLIRGRLNLLEGDPGLGKTWAALAFTAAVAGGHAVPGDVPRTNGPVLWISAEDDPADTLRPRLDAVGADVTKVYILRGMTTVNEAGETITGVFTLEDIAVLRDAVAKLHPVMVVLDPLSAVLGPNVDMNRANETRAVLSALANLANEYNFAAVIIRHLRKGSAERSIYRGQGSIDFTAAARSVLLVGEDPADDKRRVLVHLKSSLAATANSLGFELSGGTFTWTGERDVTAEQVLAPKARGEERTALDEAKEWLTELLTPNPVPVLQLKREAAQAGISWRTVERAKSELQIVARRESSGNTGAGQWKWYLPTLGRQEPNASPDENTWRPSGLADDAANNGAVATPPTENMAALSESRLQREDSQDRNTANTSHLEPDADQVPPDLAFRANHLLTSWAKLSPTNLRKKWEAAASREPQASKELSEALASDPLPTTVALSLHANKAGTLPQCLAAVRASQATGPANASIARTLVPPP